MHTVYDPTYVAALKYEEPIVAAPANSDLSDEDIDLFWSTDSENPEQQKGKPNPLAKFKKIDPRVYEISNYNNDNLREFPHKYREGELPWKVLRI